MMRHSFVFIAVLLCACSACAADSFNKRVHKANTLLQNGDSDGALTLYRELQVEDPESDLLYYNIGDALYQQALQNVDLKATEDAVESLNNAKASFEKVLNAPDPDIRMNAAYNHANSVALIAQQSAGMGKHEETVKAFEECVKEYEDFLKQYPDHKQARTNLDHMRYLLKSMLQNPPPPEDQQQQQQQDQQEQQKQQEQQNKNQEQSQESQQDSQQSQSEEQKDQEQQQAQQQEQEQQQQEQQQQDKQQKQEQQAQAQQSQEQSEQDQQQEASETEPNDKQNQDALLQSLEDADTREQKEIKNDRRDIKMKGSNWW